MNDVQQNTHLDLSVIIVTRDYEEAVPVRQIYDEYKQEIEKTGLRFEFIFVVAGEYPEQFSDLCTLKEAEPCIKIIKFSTWHTDAAAVSAGFDHAAGDVFLTLPFFHQVDPSLIPTLFEAMADYDMVIARRYPRTDSWMNQLQTRGFHFMLRKAVDVDFHDLGCNVRLLKRGVARSVHIYGDQHRFFPVLVSKSGFKVKEVDMPQRTGGFHHRRYASGIFIRRLLDLLSIFFLVKFTRKPLRFFGLTGLFIFLLGAAGTAFLAFQRVFMGEALADRPVLLLGLLLIVLGIQMYAIGLIGELIIFVHAKDVKDYAIEKIVN